jgi:hypothetical protein
MAGQSKEMAAEQLFFEKLKKIEKWQWKYENVCEVQRQWRREFAAEPPTLLTIARIRDKFEADRTVHKQISGRTCTATGPISSAVMLEQCTRSAHTSANQCACETGISRSSVQRILKRYKWKVYIPRLLRAMNAADPDQREQFCEWFQHKVHEDEQLESKIGLTKQRLSCMV